MHTAIPSRALHRQDWICRGPVSFLVVEKPEFHPGGRSAFLPLRRRSRLSHPRLSSWPKSTNLRPVLYLVDDFTESHRLAQGESLAPAILTELTDAIQGSQILVISEGLQARMREVYSVSSHVIPLPYPEASPLPEASLLPQVLFVGNVSHFYQEGLRGMAEVIAEINRETDAGLTLRITLDKPEVVAKNHRRLPVHCVW